MNIALLPTRGRLVSSHCKMHTSRVKYQRLCSPCDMDLICAESVDISSTPKFQLKRHFHSPLRDRSLFYRCRLAHPESQQARLRNHDTIVDAESTSVSAHLPVIVLYTMILRARTIHQSQTPAHSAPPT